MRISSLVFLRTLMQHHDPTVFHPHLSVTLNCVIGAIQVIIIYVMCQPIWFGIALKNTRTLGAGDNPTFN